MLYMIIIFISIVTNAYRNLQMFHVRSFKIPMLLVLHLGLLFMIIGFTVKMLAIFYPSINQNRESIHPTLTGELGVISIGIMTLVSLGHTVQLISVDMFISIAFVSIIIGAITRTFAPFFLFNFYDTGRHCAAGFWTLSFLIYFFRFLKPLVH